MGQNPFLAFISLTLFDRDIVLQEEQIVSLEKDVGDVVLKKEDLVVQLDQAKQKVHDFQKAVDTTELEMRELDLKEKEEKNKFDNVTNQKEYNSIKKEIDQVNSLQHDKEAEVVNAWNKLETARRDFTKIEESFEENFQQVEQQLVDIYKEIEAAKLELQEKIKERPSKEVGLPEEWLERYSAIKQSVSDPVVPVLNDSCSVCFYQVPVGDLSSLKRNKLLQCKGCYRFLYLEDSADQD